MLVDFIVFATCQCLAMSFFLVLRTAILILLRPTKLIYLIIQIKDIVVLNCFIYGRRTTILKLGYHLWLALNILNQLIYSILLLENKTQLWICLRCLSNQAPWDHFNHIVHLSDLVCPKTVVHYQDL